MLWEKFRVFEDSEIDFEGISKVVADAAGKFFSYSMEEGLKLEGEWNTGYPLTGKRHQKDLEPLEIDRYKATAYK